IQGRADHAGTCPMTLRKDALTGAAELVLAVENIGRSVPGLVATVGCLDVLNSASNVVPSEVAMTLDVRHAENSVRRAALETLEQRMRVIAEPRHLSTHWEVVQESPSVACSSLLIGLLSESAQAIQGATLRLCSGAGHDAVILSRVAPMGMLFVRCKDGVSHHPAESVDVDDFRVAIQVMCDALAKWRGGL
ncbi:MAG: M20/M25/M40 family metallo-hydrolase, partial [Terrimicrobiaceae bacterium]